MIPKWVKRLVNIPTKQKSLARLEWLSKFLDSSIPLGTTGYRIGMDPLVGLIPVIGDPLSALIGSYLILEAAQLGASRLTLAKMMINLGIDALLGAVPFVGDLFDFAFKANEKNLRLVQEARLGEVENPGGRLTSAFISTLGVLLIFLTIIFSLVVFITAKLFSFFLN
jgi:hypothetical protein